MICRWVLTFGIVSLALAGVSGRQSRPIARSR
jgi:hypothetical protein